MKEDTQIDISKLKPIIKGHFFINLSEESICILNIFPETLERAKMALYFIQQMGFQNDDIKKAEGYFRAGLSEFVSMEETLWRETKTEGVKIFDTQHPLLILLKLLRNIEVHLDTRKLSETQCTFLWGNPQGEIDLPIFVINGIRIDELKNLQGYKKFQKDEEKLIMILDWFCEEISHWGIAEIIVLGIHEYIFEIDKMLSEKNRK